MPCGNKNEHRKAETFFASSGNLSRSSQKESGVSTHFLEAALDWLTSKRPKKKTALDILYYYTTKTATSMTQYVEVFFTTFEFFCPSVCLVNSTLDKSARFQFFPSNQRLFCATLGLNGDPKQANERITSFQSLPSDCVFPIRRGKIHTHHW